MDATSLSDSFCIQRNCGVEMGWPAIPLKGEEGPRERDTPEPWQSPRCVLIPGLAKEKPGNVRVRRVPCWGFQALVSCNKDLNKTVLLEKQVRE